MWTENGRVQHIKALGLSREDEYAEDEAAHYREHPDVIFHMRLKTHGKVIPSLCHPFRILSKSRHGRDMFFMHNGVLSAYGNNLNYGQSDTTAFKDKLLVPLLSRNPEGLDDPAIMETIQKATSGSRLIFMDSEGNVWRTSPSQWNDNYGLTLSNTYMICMGNKELLAFIKDDPETTETIFSELVEIVFEQNDILSHDPTCEDFTFDYDALTELGSIDHHQASMKMISDKRKEEYARLAAIAAEKEEAERQQPKKKNKKVA
jgi:hypothetical protein